MISKTTRPCIEVLAALLCATTASAQDNRGTPDKGPPARPAPFACGSYTLRTRPGSSNACRRTYPVSAEPADRCSNQAPGRRRQPIARSDRSTCEPAIKEI
jgi:hypothetical protein